MKIISQSDNEMVLKEGNASGIAFGIVFVVVGVLGGFFLRAANPIAVWIALAFGVIGVAMIFLSSSITMDANKASGQMVYQKKRLIGGSVSAYAIADVLRVETRKQWRMENTGSENGRAMPRQVLVSQSVIVFKDGRELPIDHQKSSSGMSVGSGILMGGQGTEVAIATQVANFLGVPFQEIAPPNSGMGINIGGIQL